MKAFRWHQKYTLPVTDSILGKIACLVLSKILGIGTATCNWKQVQKIKKGDNMNTGIYKCTKMVLVYGQYQQLHAEAKLAKLSVVGKLWEEADFECMKIDEYCSDLLQALDKENAHIQQKSILQNWKESRDKKKLTSSGDIILLEQLRKKYVGLKLDKMECDQDIYIILDVEREDRNGNNINQLIQVTKHYTMELDKNDPLNMPHWKFWHFCDGTYP